MLGKLMEADGIPHTGLLVCGGAALNALGITSYSTKDVDVICTVEESDGQIRFIQREWSIPVDLIDTVARDLALPTEDRYGDKLPNDRKWLNNGPWRLLDYGLPEDLAQRLIKRDYGQRLSVYFVSRYDQIHLKLYACLASERVAVHQRDLIGMDVSDAEMETAARWLLSKTLNAKTTKKLREVLFELGHEKVIQELGLQL